MIGIVAVVVFAFSAWGIVAYCREQKRQYTTTEWLEVMRKHKIGTP